ncbi:MAG TPA: ribonuclease E/G [Emcibacteraceae bacterium]|mgnify:CR=1 FL=1|nr:ribonuclease E/G [Emcibacteraceae bacterium]HRW30049.1 ribonuclease E/G [Emcibacteraceae bacterium]
MNGNSKILINSAIGETRMAQIENGQVTDLRLYRDHDPSYIGAIYLGRVISLSKELQAAFVELAKGFTGFLPLKNLPKRQGKKPNDLTTLLHEGQRIIVQVTADAIKDKLVKLTGRVELISSAIVLHPFRGGAYVSSRIKDPDKREELKQFGEQMDLGEIGLTFRTDAQSIPLSELASTAQKMIDHWSQISKDTEKMKCPSLLTQGPDPIEQIMRDYLKNDIEEIIIDQAAAFKQAKLWAQTFAPDMTDRLVIYQEKTPLFSQYEVDDVIEQICSEKISLKSGAWITIEATEAMTVIDVNTGAAQFSSDPQMQIFSINSEATREIFRQLKLRGIGGIIIIDFINMENKGQVKSLLNFIDDLILKDPEPVQRGNISPLGLLALTRKSSRKNLHDLLIRKNVSIKNTETVCLDILRGAENDARSNPGLPLVIKVNKNEKKWFEDHSIVFDQFLTRTGSNLSMEMK